MSVSDTIGKLLLEGYKMLADSCEICCTVLMQDRRGRIICVNCESSSGASSMRASGKMTNGGLNVSKQDDNGLTLTTISGSNNSAQRNNSTDLVSCEEVLTKEIQNATTTLQNLSQLQHDLQGKLMYIRYIKECAETIQALKGIKKT